MVSSEEGGRIPCDTTNLELHRTDVSFLGDLFFSQQRERTRGYVVCFGNDILPLTASWFLISFFASIHLLVLRSTIGKQGPFLLIVEIFSIHRQSWLKHASVFVVLQVYIQHNSPVVLSTEQSIYSSLLYALFGGSLWMIWVPSLWLGWQFSFYFMSVSK